MAYVIFEDPIQQSTWKNIYQTKALFLKQLKLLQEHVYLEVKKDSFATLMITFPYIVSGCIICT